MRSVSWVPSYAAGLPSTGTTQMFFQHVLLERLNGPVPMHRPGEAVVFTRNESLRPFTAKRICFQKVGQKISWKTPWRAVCLYPTWYFPPYQTRVTVLLVCESGKDPYCVTVKFTAVVFRLERQLTSIVFGTSLSRAPTTSWFYLLSWDSFLCG